MKDYKAQFGLYVEAITDALVMNDMMFPTHECIALEPAGNW